MKSTVRTPLLAVAALLLVAAVGCAPSPGGGGGGGAPAIQTGCFESVLWGPGGGRAKIFQGSSNTWFWQAYDSPTCSGPANGAPTQIYPGQPGPIADASCRAIHGPDATSSDQLARLLIPRQNFWSCNYPI